ncbi:LOW QUALITY PROTEIN: odorant receptor 46a [Drosophila tropicalis]|uniref:LOW QUALITY PROTEIN: odorant receptor 46a n=1 Tax=Drosophila tropicalis TaxID=46794 RepID=UPI0035ABE8BE
MVNITPSVKLFYGGQQKLLHIFSLWPSQVIGHRWLRWAYMINFVHVLVFWCLLFDLILVLYMILNISVMDEVIKAFFLLATLISYTFKFIFVKANGMHFLQLFQRFQEDEVTHGGYSPEEQYIFNSAIELSRKLRNYYGSISLSALLMIIFSQYCIDPNELPLATYVPFDVSDSTSFRYRLMYGYQCVALTLSCIFNIFLDSMFASIFIYVRCQMDILASKLRKIDANLEEPVEMQLKKCIQYYMNINELNLAIEKLVSKPISVQIMCSVLVLTVNFYALSLLSDNGFVFLKFFLYQSCMLVEIFILCFFAGEITEGNLVLDIYKSDWVQWKKSDRRLMLIFMQRLNRPIRIRSINASQAFDLALFVSEILKVFFMFATEVACMAKLLHIRLEEGQLQQLPILMESKDFIARNEEERKIKAKFMSSVVKLRNYYGLSSVVISLELTCWLNIAFDSMIYGLLCYCQGLLEILVMRLENLGAATNPLEQRLLANRLRDCCMYYNHITHFKDLVELLIKLPGSVQLLCSVLVLVSNLYSLSYMSVAGEAPLMLKTVIYQLVMLLQIFMVCYASNEVTLQSSRLCNALYSSQWFTWNMENRRTACLLMLRFSAPLSIGTLNPTFTFSLNAFGSIVNCSYSYFALLKRVNS